MGDSVPKPCIFHMYEDNRAYKPGDPFFLKIGPYFFWTPKSLEDAIFEFVLQRTNRSKGDLVNAMANIAMEVREYFEGATLPLDGFKENDKFVERMVRDGCLVLEVMYVLATKPYPLRTLSRRFCEAIIAANMTMLRHIRLDMLCVVNQIPLNFLKDLYKELYNAHPSFEDILNSFLNGYPVQKCQVPNLAGACHLLDAARMKLLPKMVLQCHDADRSSQGSLQDQQGDGSAQESLENHDADRAAQTNLQNQDADGFASTGTLGEMSIRYCAVDLKLSFVTILPATEGMVKWTHRTVRNSLLQLPPMLINRDSHVIFKNIVAYEQRIAEDNNQPVQPVSSYLRLLSDLLLTVDDARALTSRGIIDNQLGSLDDIVNFFRDLNLRDTYMIDMLSQTRKQINEHCQRKWISSLADLRRTFFRSRWQYWTFVGAIILLVLTVLQVLYAILAYHRPSNST